MTTQKPRLLLLAAGRKVGLMRSLERYFKVYPSGLGLLASTSACLAGGERFIEQPLLLNEYQRKDWVLATCEHHKIDLVIPVRDKDVGMLCHVRGETVDPLKEMGTDAIHCGILTHEVAWSKSKMYEQLKDRLNTPEVFPVERSLADSFDGHLFLKPVYGAGSKDSEQFFSGTKIPGNCMTKSMILQEMICGSEFTIDMFFDRESKLIQACCRERLSVSDGQMDSGVVGEIDNNLQQQLDALQKELLFVGPINVQFIRDDDGKYWLIDINCRFGGGTPLSIAAGADFVKYLYQMHAGEEITPGEIKIGTRAASYIDYIFEEPA